MSTTDEFGQEEMLHLQELLTIHRRTLAHSLQQHQVLGVLTPSGLIHSIHDGWKQIAQIKATLGANDIAVNDEPEDEPRELAISAPTLSGNDRRNRSRMLERVKNFWIDGVLSDSLYDAARIELGMESKPDAIARPLDKLVRLPERPSRRLPPNAQILNVFDALGGELLILGAPGSGKTTTLLTLARDLLTRAEQDDLRPMPIVFNLSSWAESYVSIADWLVDELNIRYYVPKKLGKLWTDANQVLPLLDGLDEIKQLQRRAACVQAINDYRLEQGLAHIVVCSRIADYEVLATRLQLEGAILLLPLTPQQVDTYLERAGGQLAALSAALADDAELRAMVQSPLMLSILSLAYRDMAGESLPVGGTVAERRTHLLAEYVDRMLQRWGVGTRYTRQQTMHWLAWLAYTMDQHGQSELLIERLQPSWLPHTRQRWLYALGVGLVTGLMFGSIAALGRWLAFGLGWALVWGRYNWRMWIMSLVLSYVINITIRPGVGALLGIPRCQSGLFVCTDLAVTFGLIGGMTVGIRAWQHARDSSATAIRPVEQLVWSWRRAAVGFVAGSVLGLALVLVPILVLLLIFGSLVSTTETIVRASSAGIALGLVGGLVFSAARGMTFRDLQEAPRQLVPNQGMWNSARNALLVCFAVGPGLWLGLRGVKALPSLFNDVSAALIETYEFTLNQLFGNILPLNGVLGLGLAVGLGLGGFACIQHAVLRLLLWRGQQTPWNYAQFLDYAAEHLLLRKVGRGYIFIHRLLLEYFAALYPDRDQIKARRMGDELHEGSR